jgi:hypothetical protein
MSDKPEWKSVPQEPTPADRAEIRGTDAVLSVQHDADGKWWNYFSLSSGFHATNTTRATCQQTLIHFAIAKCEACIAKLRALADDTPPGFAVELIFTREERDLFDRVVLGFQTRWQLPTPGAAVARMCELMDKEESQS